mmetsp:Transcript_8184/g.17032  ORF Transcript_8184/g.17032 Transcript_8184/m.17032 type:complete len:1445 (+) Transcript_8184:133-4467(+)
MGNARSTLDGGQRPPGLVATGNAAERGERGVTNDTHSNASSYNNECETPSHQSSSRGRLHSLEEPSIASTRRRSSMASSCGSDVCDGGENGDRGTAPWIGPAGWRQSPGQHFSWFPRRRANPKSPPSSHKNDSSAAENPAESTPCALESPDESITTRVDDEAGHHSERNHCGDAGDITTHSETKSNFAQHSHIHSRAQPVAPRGSTNVASMPSPATQRMTPLAMPMAPPIGLLGPSCFEFSPSSAATSPDHPPLPRRAGSSNPPLHLSFVSCSHHMDALARSSGHDVPLRSQAVRKGSTCAVSPVDGNASQGQQSSALERRLYVLDLEPFLRGDSEEAYLGLEEKEHDDFVCRDVGDKTTAFDMLEAEDQSVLLHRRGKAAQMSVPLIRLREHEAAPGTEVVGILKNGNAIDSYAPSESKAAKSNTREETGTPLSLQERLRRERQRFVWSDDGDSGGFTQFEWSRVSHSHQFASRLRILVPHNGNVFIQDGVDGEGADDSRCPNYFLTSLYDKKKMAWDLYYTRCWEDERRAKCLAAGEKRQKRSATENADDLSLLERGKCTDTDDSEMHLDLEYPLPNPSAFFTAANAEHFVAAMKAADSGGSLPSRDLSAIDPQMSPDGTMVAFVVAGEIYVVACDTSLPCNSPTDHCCCVNGTNPNDGENGIKDQTFGGCSNSIELQQRMPIRVTFESETEDGMHLDGFFRGFHAATPGNVIAAGSSSSKRRVHSNTCNAKTPSSKHVTHGLADFVAQEEMDRYRGFWWSPDSKGILFTQVDESMVPPYRIMHEGRKTSSNGLSSWGLGSGGGGRHSSDTSSSTRHDNQDELVYEDHRYPFAGKENPSVKLGYIEIDRRVILGNYSDCGVSLSKAKNSALSKWMSAKLFNPPPLASEYLARVIWLPDGAACAQWQDRHQSVLQLVRIDVNTGEDSVLLTERSDVWINLHNMFWPLDRPIHPDECFPVPMVQPRQCELSSNNTFLSRPLPLGSFSFLFASERTGFSHLYLYTYVAGSKDEATLLRTISGGDWVVEDIIGIDLQRDLVYVAGTFDSPLEKHLYALPITNKNCKRHYSTCVADFSISDPPDPIRLTKEPGMHCTVMDNECRIVVDTRSDLNKPPSTHIYTIQHTDDVHTSEDGRAGFECCLKLLFVLHDSEVDDISPPGDSIDAISQGGARSKHRVVSKLRAPELLTINSHGSVETLYGALYTPDKSIFGHGPYPLVCSVYGGPHVQRVNRTWSSMTADMRAQRLTTMGFVVLKCDNRGSSRRGLNFEGYIKGRLGNVEVLDQVAAVKHLVELGIADPFRVGIYGWSYGGYLAAMCLSRAPDVFSCAVAGAPVTCWSLYDTHYTERYMGIPDENVKGYKESAIFDHVVNIKGKLMLVHGLIDENVHFRHTARLINHLVAEGKDYDLMVFPDERHSPRRLTDRLYMEKKICEYFVRNLVERRQPF